MSDLDRGREKCERDIVQLRGELDTLQSEMIDVAGGCLRGSMKILAKVEVCNRQMFADLQAQTEAGFASLQACINALPLPLSERKKGDPPKMN